MTHKIYPNVRLGKNVTIGDYVVIGEPPRGKAPGDLETVIGDNAVIRSHTVIYAGNVIGNNFQTGNHTNIRECNNIGDNVSIGTMSVVEFNVKIEDNVRIHSRAFIPEYCVLKKGCWIGPGVVLTNAAYPLSAGAKTHLKGVIVAEDAKIGANSTILPGKTLGRGCLVGAGSVVTKDVDELTVVAGNPARMIKKLDSLSYSDGTKAY